MKKSFVWCLIVLFIMSTSIISCGDKKDIRLCDNDGICEIYTFDTYGFINSGDKKNDNVEYRLIVGNVVWSIILVETVIAPFYFWGFSIYEPVGIKDKSHPKGAVN